ncbi:hypothetical protein HXY33_08745 [Candidatus Bathyarchaeota archaeon]|nr:hypothetical protein [Candidatus Bathyarchaeota archaeon]
MGKLVKIKFELKEKTKERFSPSPQKLFKFIKSTYLNADSKSTTSIPVHQSNRTTKICDTEKAEAIMLIQRQLSFLG